ncbi:helix-turn-helix domain-containing protein [uncultured Actinomyces sp.]|uniref:helix-turn-helix domain-containing protein n=1 Tax=uncultured Actinomyces sp. TaxID=249061 RepID=UPI00260E3AFC|nr:helix-turn-helix domain-containing protein [uncultured Actinomyces sp.]
MENQLMSSKEVAELLNVTVSTLNQWAYRKQNVPFIKVGGQRRYKKADVERFLKVNYQKVEVVA